MSSKVNAQDRKDFDTFTKTFLHKSIQIIVQSRLGKKIKTESNPLPTTDRFNIAINNNNEVLAESKKVLGEQTSVLSQTVCVEISLLTTEGDTMVLEIWCISLDVSQADLETQFSQTGYRRMGSALKSLLSTSRVTPAYKLSRRHATGGFIICYRVSLGEPYFNILGDGYETAKVACVPTPYGTITVNVSYRTTMLIAPKLRAKDVFSNLIDGHFQDGSIPRPPSRAQVKKTSKDIHLVCVFAQNVGVHKNDDPDDVPFISLLQQNTIENKIGVAKQNISERINITESDTSKKNASDLTLSDSKMCTSSQTLVVDDFVMMKTPFAAADANTDLGIFYHDCLSAPSLNSCDEEQSVPETFEKLKSELDKFETTMEKFDEFVSELNNGR